MKSGEVIEAFRRFLSGRSDEAVTILHQISASETGAGRVGVARQIDRLLTSRSMRPMVALPNAPESLEIFQGTRPLCTMAIPPSVLGAVESLVREWKAKDVLAEHGLPIRRTVLLHGPSGNGKTTLAHAIATELGLPLAVAQYEHLIDSHLGCTGQNVARLFAFAKTTPCVLLIDEADALVKMRHSGGESAGHEGNRIVSSVIMGLDGLENSLLVLATNAVEMIDFAVLRRCILQLEMPAPDDCQRRQMTRLLSTRWPVLQKCSDWQEGAETAPNFAAIEECAMSAARDHVLRLAANAPGRHPHPIEAAPP